VSIFTKRNAAVGYLTLKALDRRRRQRSGIRLGVYIALGIISVGILAGLAAVLMQRRSATAEESEGSAAMATESDEASSEIVGEYVTAASEPISAT
jgi:Tfp pilus assembly protein PilN